MNMYLQLDGFIRKFKGFLWFFKSYLLHECMTLVFYLWNIFRLNYVHFPPQSFNICSVGDREKRNHIRLDVLKKKKNRWTLYFSTLHLVTFEPDLSFSFWLNHQLNSGSTKSMIRISGKCVSFWVSGYDIPMLGQSIFMVLLSICDSLFGKTSGISIIFSFHVIYLCLSWKSTSLDSFSVSWQL